MLGASPVNYDKAPFPWFGGKSKAAETVWKLLGDVPHYVEPFAGSLAVLIGRPHQANRPYFSETVNDLDGHIVNVWRAIQTRPEEVAEHASWPVTEADKQARQIAWRKWIDDDVLDLLAGSADWCDPRMAGWWLYGVACQIGAVGGPWTSDPETGRIFKQDRRLQERTPGVLRDLPHVSNNGQGVNHAGTREPGVSRDLPNLSDNGRGVNHAGTREPGVSVLDDIGDPQYHPLVMPKLTEWMQHLSARLRHVRVLNGDWKRTVTTGAAHTIPVRSGKGPVGIFLDPPYDNEERARGLYSGDADDGSVAAECLRWCLDLDPDDPKWRVVLAGYDTEHAELEDAGWTCHEWFAGGYLTGGMGNVGDGGHQQDRERLWASPQCDVDSLAAPQQQLFG